MEIHLKGKRIDSEFVSSFIEKCIGNNLLSTEEMLNFARNELLNIDSKIKEVENLKKIRPKILDVICTLQSDKKLNKSEDYKVLLLFNIKDKNICRFICKSIKEKPIDINGLLSEKYNVGDINFAIKQLIELKVLYKSGNYLLRGDMFDSYVANVMCED